ncbi:MAG: adenosyl-hopene transferase HpnH [Desulfovibrionales bacterium]
MGIPRKQKVRIGRYIFEKLIRGDARFPLVLMLEPLFRCNLRCQGCGKVNYPPEVLNRMLSVQDCIDAAEECGAPVVSIPGGEPLLHPEIQNIASELTSRKRFVYLCTNALLLQRKIDLFTPSPYLTFSIHVDGFEKRHDTIVNRRGVFENAVEAIKLLVSRGFRVTTNTTFFRGETPENAARLFDFLSSLGVEGMMVSSAFSYENAAYQNGFMSRDETKELFGKILANGRSAGWPFNHSKLYMQFLAGKKEYACTPWGNPTRNIFGWQRPCYLLDDGYADSFEELMIDTDWNRYGAGRDPRCTNCMVHCGFEPTAVLQTVKRPWTLLSKKSHP